MKTLKDLFEIEFKNLYAIEKQTCEIVDRIRYIFNDKSTEKRFQKFISNAQKSKEGIQAYLAEQKINPGSTTDSVMQEMLQNIVDITNKRINKDIKEMGLLCSLNRATHYKIACYKNVRTLAKQLGIENIDKEIKTIRKTNSKEVKKIKASTLKSAG